MTLRPGLSGFIGPEAIRKSGRAWWWISIGNFSREADAASNRCIRNIVRRDHFQWRWVHEQRVSALLKNRAWLTPCSPITLTGAFIIAWSLVAAVAFPQARRDSPSARIIPAAKAGLEAIPAPPLEKMEAAVARQMEAMAGELSQAAAKAGVSDAELAEAYGALGQLYNAYEVSEAALACYRNANRLAPGDFRWLHLLGYASAQAGNIEKAAVYFRAARAINPKYAATAVRLGDAFLQLNRMEDARREWQAALAVDPKNGAAHAGLGDAALAAKKYAEAIPHFEAALVSVPAANRLHYSLAMAYRGVGKREEARAHLAKRGSVGVRPVDPIVDGLQDLVDGEKAHLLRGQVAFAAERFGEAATEFSKAVRTAPRSLPARINLGTALDKQGDAKGAIEQFRAALEIDAGQLTAHFNLGSILMRQGQHSEAVAHFEAVLAEDPGDLTAKKALAESLASSGKPRDALRHFSEALKAQPDDEPALIGTVDLLVRGEAYREALGLLDGAHNKYPDRLRTANALARLLAGCPEIALRDGERALRIASRLFEEQPTVAYGETVAMAMAQLGRCKEAAELQRKLAETASRAGEGPLAATLARTLAGYESGPPCAPPGS